ATSLLLLAALLVGGGLSIWQAMQTASAKEAAAEARLALSRREQRAARERADAIARDLESLNAANALIERGRQHARFRAWAKPERQANWIKAEADFSEAVALRPDHSHVWTARAEFYGRLGLWDLAAADLKKAVARREPESASGWVSHAILSYYGEDRQAY